MAAALMLSASAISTHHGLVRIDEIGRRFAESASGFQRIICPATHDLA